MSNQHEELAQAWIKKAEHDLILAQQALVMEIAPSDRIYFHIKQAIEKTLRALLMFKLIEYPETSKLLQLFEITKPIMPEIKMYHLYFAELDEFANKINYPITDSNPDCYEFTKKWAIAREIFEKIKIKLA